MCSLRLRCRAGMLAHRVLGSGFRDNRLTSMCVSSTIHGRRLLSFACPKESNQRKGHPRGRGLPASLPANFASRLRGPLTAHPCAEIGRARILRAPACGARGCFLHLLAAAERDREEQSAAVPAAEAPDIGDTPHAVIPAKA